MTTTQDIQHQATVNLMRYKQTDFATKFYVDETREVVVQTTCLDTARRIVEERHG